MTDPQISNTQPPLEPPTVALTLETAAELVRNLAPVLEAEGVGLHVLRDSSEHDSSFVTRNETHRRESLSPVGIRRDMATALLLLTVGAVINDETVLAGQLLDSVVTTSPNNTQVEASSCLGMSLALLDAWLSGQNPNVPEGLALILTLPTGPSVGAQAAARIWALAETGRAFHSLEKLTERQTSAHVLASAVVVMAATIQAWAGHIRKPEIELLGTIVR
jgi:hypothetical protein